MSTLVLSKDEIFELTHYRRPAEQMRALKVLNLPAVLRHDNTVCVLRADLTARERPVEPQVQKPMLKSTRLRLEAEAREREFKEKLDTKKSS